VQGWGKMYLHSMHVSYKDGLDKTYRENNRDNISYAAWLSRGTAFLVLPVCANGALCLVLGGKLWMMLEKAKLLDIVLENISTGKTPKTVHRVIIPTKIFKLISKSYLLKRPNRFPMICPPVMYNGNDYGGYLLNKDHNREKLMIPKWLYGDKTTDIRKGSYLVDSVNICQQVPFKIYNQMLDFIIENNEKITGENQLLQNLLNEIIKVKSEDKRLHEHHVNKRRSLESKRLQTEMIVGIASIYHDLDIYFPIRVDTRTRNYPQPDYLNYQSTEVAKSLLQFKVPGMIEKENREAIMYFKAYGG